MTTTMTSNNAPLSADERAELEALRAMKRQQDEANNRKRERDAYYQIVDDAIDECIPKFELLSTELKLVKGHTLDLFRRVIAMKRESLGMARTGQFTHTFTHSDGSKRIRIGMHTTDNYRDMVDDGIEMVTKYLESLAGDDEKAWLVKAVMRLLARDATGNLKASRVMQLRKLAEESGSAELLEGVKIIEESYLPSLSKMFIRVQVKDAQNAWINVPLSVTEVESDSSAGEVITGEALINTEDAHGQEQ